MNAQAKQEEKSMAQLAACIAQIEPLQNKSGIRKMPATPDDTRLCGHAPEHMRNKNGQNAFQRHFLHPSPQNAKKKKSLKIKDFLLVAPI